MTPDLLTEIDRAFQAYVAHAQDLTLTATDFYDWLASLPSSRQDELSQCGLRTSHIETEFFRFCLVQRGINLGRFMAANLSLLAFNLWAATSAPAGRRRFGGGYVFSTSPPLG